MIKGLKPYPSYKDSGVPWLGEVPTHWRILPNRALFEEIKDRNHPDEELLSVTINKGIIRQEALLKDSSKKDSSNQNKTAYKLVCPGDIAYNKMRAWQGAVGVSDYRGIVSPAYIVMRLREANNARYFHHLYRTPHFAKEAERWSYGITSDMWSLRPEHFKMIYSPIPYREEQDAIVRFLNKVGQQIRRYINVKQKLIILLEERMKSIILSTITRGLNTNVSIKPSGIKWIGGIPEHWEVTQIRRLISYVTSGSRGWADFYSEAGDIFLQSGNLGISMSLDLSTIQHVQPPPGAEGERTKVRRDDVLICITGALTGNVIIVDNDLPSTAVYVNQHVALVRPNKERIYPRFLSYALHSEVGRLQFKTGEYGGTKQGLGLDDVKSAIIPVPPIQEQIAICSELDTKVTEIEIAIKHINYEVKLLREYRSRLLTNVVTGKLDVREVLPNMIYGTENFVVRQEPPDEVEISIKEKE